MRFYVESIDRPKALSERLDDRLFEMGYEIRFGADMLIARMYGYRNWKDLLGNIGVHQPDLFDEVTDTLIVASRRAFLVAALVKSGVKRIDAGSLVDEIVPPSSWEAGKLEF